MADVHRLTVQYFDPTDGTGFEAVYRDRHVPIVQEVPGLARFTLSTPRGTGDTPHLVAELWFEDAETMKSALGSPQMSRAAEDAETYDVARRVRFAAEVDDVATTA